MHTRIKWKLHVTKENSITSVETKEAKNLSKKKIKFNNNIYGIVERRNLDL